MHKFADYPVVMLDIYGRERHPEAASMGGQYIQESYADRRARAELMLWTLQKVPGGSVADGRYILIDPDNDNRIFGPEVHTTVVTHLYGGRPQTGIVIDLNGKIIHTLPWESPARIDEVLSNIFGLEPGLN